MADDATRAAVLRRGFVLEYVTLAWNVAGIVVLAVAAILARSVALAGFGLDSLIEIGAPSPSHRPNLPANSGMAALPGYSGTGH